MASRIVSLSFQASVSQSEVSPSVSDLEVKQALKVIDDSLVSHGFVRDLNPPEAHGHGFVASYSKFDDEGLVRLRPLVWLVGDRLEVVFAEGRVPGGRISTATKATVNMLRTEMRSHYGSRRVTVEHGPD